MNLQMKQVPWESTEREREREKGGETVKGEFESRTSTTELAHQPTGSQSTEHVIWREHASALIVASAIILRESWSPLKEKKEENPTKIWHLWYKWHCKWTVYLWPLSYEMVDTMWKHLHNLLCCMHVLQVRVLRVISFLTNPFPEPLFLFLLWLPN